MDLGFKGRERQGIVRVICDWFSSGHKKTEEFVIHVPHLVRSWDHGQSLGAGRGKEL